MLFALVLCLIPTITIADDLAWAHQLNRAAEEMAKSPNEEAQSIVERSEFLAEQRQVDAKILAKKGETAIKNPEICRAAQLTAGQKTDDSLPEEDDKKYPDLLIFVSTSMPDETIKALAAQARPHGGKIVFRGLIGGSFKEMALKLKHLGVESLIDPTLFVKHKVEMVPTFITKKHRLTGNVSVSYVMEKFGEEKND